ncbi:MAG: hypothetical protein IPL58_03445 [Betaproteobacteria bacterium]|uniref:Uncharacterized protein n=1 Tax=Candidatus Proximibacter danicus TaxID=2954365 RepID=A0A9D7JYY7_9PROT|nr:hypothetical protein [Candidatus Proximibacter danicus]
MKKIIVTAFLAAASFGASAAVTSICTGVTPGAAGTAPAKGTAGTHFMVTAIAPKCSANVFLEGEDGTNGSYYAVGSASAKGKTTFGGSTARGAVAAGVACTVAGGCVKADATAGLTAAKTAAGT